MGSGEVEVVGIAVPFRHDGGAQGEVGPVEMDACHMSLLDAPPPTQSMQPIFQFVMMPGQDEEEDEETRERAIAPWGTSPFVKGNRDRQADCKGRQSPAGEPFAEPSSLDIQAVDPAQDSKEAGLPGWDSGRCDDRLHHRQTILIV